MRSDIISLKTEVNDLKKKKDRNGKREPSEIRNQRGGKQWDSWEKAKCEDCRKGQVDDFRHCFVCGGINHIACRCPSSDTVNDNRLRKWGICQSKQRCLIIFVHIVEKKAQNQTSKLVVIVRQYSIVEVNVSNNIGIAIRKYVRQYLNYLFKSKRKWPTVIIFRRF